MNEVIEKAALRLAAKRGFEYKIRPGTMGDLRRCFGEQIFDEVRAVIEALREPTEAMIEAGWQIGNAGFGEGEDMATIWRAMIDEVLK